MFERIPLSVSKIVKRRKSTILKADQYPYLNIEETTLKGRNQRKVLTLSETLFSDDVPWTEGPPFSFFLQSFRSGQVGWFVSSSYLRNFMSSFVIMLGKR